MEKIIIHTFIAEYTEKKAMTQDWNGWEVH